MQVIVIGSGLSGLTAAALLAKEGHSVKVFEQHEMIGGVTAAIEKDGYRWDLGQMLIPDLSEGEPGRKVIERLGISDKIKVVKSYRENYFPDFRISRSKEFKGIYWRKEYFKELFPEDANGLDAYYKIYDIIHDLSSLMNKKEVLSKLKLFFTYLRIKKKREWSAQKVMDFYFSNKKLQSIFIGILADYVCSPDFFPGLIIPTINAESQYDERVPLDYGRHEHRPSWTFIINGCLELVNALAEVIINHGGEIVTKIAVKKIVVENSRAKSIITADGNEQQVDAIIASGGAKELFLELIGREHFPENFVKTYVNDLFTTESVFMVHLGVDYDPSVYQNGAALCYYYLSYNIKGSIEQCKSGIYHEGKDGFLVYVPSKHSPEMAPPGHHAVSVYTIAPNNPVNGSWKENKEEWAEKLLDIAENFIPGLREHEKTRVIITPEDFRKRTLLKHHAFGGCTPHLHIPPPKHETPIKNLWFVGAQSENYGGVTNAMIGAEKVVNRLLKEMKSKTTA